MKELMVSLIPIGFIIVMLLIIKLIDIRNRVKFNNSENNENLGGLLGKRKLNFKRMGSLKRISKDIKTPGGILGKRKLNFD